MSQITAEQQITPLLHRWQEGDPQALDELVPLVYYQLSLIAHKHMRGERADHSYSTADLVHEAFVKLYGGQEKKWENRVHFFAVTGKAMRNILINYAHRKNTQKRGGSNFERVTLDLSELGDQSPRKLEDLDEAMARLHRRDKLVALAVELRYFCGFTIDEMAEALETSPATIKRKLALACVWLDRFLD